MKLGIFFIWISLIAFPLIADAIIINKSSCSSTDKITSCNTDVAGIHQECSKIKSSCYLNPSIYERCLMSEYDSQHGYTIESYCKQKYSNPEDYKYCVTHSSLSEDAKLSTAKWCEKYYGSHTKVWPFSSPGQKQDLEKNIGSSSSESSSAITSSCAANYSGNPISNATGNKIEVDYDYTGGDVFPLRFTRYYNSRSKLGRSAIGFNWTHSYSSKLKIVDTTHVDAIRDDGKKISFVLDPTDATKTKFKSDADVNSRLVKSSSSYSFITENDETEIYTLTGKLSSVTDRNGRKHAVSYGANGLVSSVTSYSGRKITFSYSGVNLVSVIFPDASKVSYLVDALGKLKTVTKQDASTTNYVYEDARFPYALSGIIDGKGVRYATWRYDANGMAISSEHAGGVGRVSLSYNLYDAVDNAMSETVVTDSKGVSRNYLYQTIQNKTKPFKSYLSPANGVNQTANVEYKPNNGSPYVVEDFLGHKTYSISVERNLPSAVYALTGNSADPYAFVKQFAWHPTFRLPVKTQDNDNRVTDFVYDAKGNLLSKTITERFDLGLGMEKFGESRKWTYTYDAKSNLLSEDGPRTDIADITKYGYDPVTSDLISVTNALGHKTTIAYNANGFPTTVTDPNGIVTKLVWNARGLLTSKSVGQQITSYTYDANGIVTSITRPGGEKLTFTIDAAHRVTGIADGLGNKAVYTLDAMDNITAIDIYDSTGVKVKTETRDYGKDNRLWHIYNAAKQAVSTFSYNANGNVTKSTDGVARSRFFFYDYLNRIDSEKGGINGITDYSYDGDSNVVDSTDAKAAKTVIKRNAFFQPIEVNSPDSGITKYTYDSAGNLKSKVDARGARVDYAYDALNRQISETELNGISFKSTYDPVGCKGKLSSFTHSGGSISYTYDSTCNLLRKVQVNDSSKLTTSYVTNPATGRLNAIIYPSGMNVAYGYDAAGQVSDIKVNGNPYITGIKHFPFGAVKSWNWAFGQNPAYARTFDLNGRISSFTLDGSGTVRKLTRDSIGRVVAVNDFVGLTAGYKATNTYNAIDSVSTYLFGVTPKTLSLTFDPNGNRTLGATSYTYKEPSNKLLTSKKGTAASVTIATDAAGYTTSDETASYIHSARGDLKQANPKSGGIFMYQYSAMHEPLTTINWTTKDEVIRVYDPAATDLLGEYKTKYIATTQPLVSREHIYLDGIPVGVTEKGGSLLAASGIIRIYPDEIGTPRKVTNPAGSLVVWDWSKADPYGETSPTGTYPISMRFKGQSYDVGTGLHFNRYRMYDPRKGRYIEPDPIGLDGGQNNLYTYVNGNPVGLVDPMGLAGPVDAIYGAISGGIGSYESSGGKIGDAFTGAAIGGLVGYFNPILGYGGVFAGNYAASVAGQYSGLWRGDLSVFSNIKNIDINKSTAILAGIGGLGGKALGAYASLTNRSAFSYAVNSRLGTTNQHVIKTLESITEGSLGGIAEKSGSWYPSSNWCN